MAKTQEPWEHYVRDIQDFPEAGIVFKDLTPLLGHPDVFRSVVDALTTHGEALAVDKVIGIEARGFLFAAAVAYQLGAGLVPVRKHGKLPYRTVTERYELEYGVDSLELHEDGIEPGDSVYVIDDILATGGTASATCRLVEEVEGRVSGLAFVAELAFLDGRTRLGAHDVMSLMQL